MYDTEKKKQRHDNLEKYNFKKGRSRSEWETEQEYSVYYRRNRS